ncbi:MAG: hypothetical protein ACXWJH_07145 [Hyphomicrobium sp.]|jgi:hypothetical protein
MDLNAAKRHEGSKWAWARTGALLLFLLTGVLLLASLSGLKNHRADTGANFPWSQIAQS